LRVSLAVTSFTLNRLCVDPRSACSSAEGFDSLRCRDGKTLRGRRRRRLGATGGGAGAV